MRLLSVTSLGGIALVVACGGREHVLGGKDAPAKQDGGSNEGTPDTGGATGAGGASSEAGGTSSSGGTSGAGDSAAGGAEPGGGSGATTGGAAGSATGGAAGSATGGAAGSATGGAAGSATGGAAGAAGALSGVGCVGACCPADRACYSSSALSNAPGAECLARIENDPSHIQLRRTWLRHTEPSGYTIDIVFATLNNSSQLAEEECNTPSGYAGYIHAIDIDLMKGEARSGYTTHATNSATARAEGLCFADVGTGVDAAQPGWVDIDNLYFPAPVVFDFSLTENQMSSAAAYPPGLPAPMPQPWKMAPVKAKRLDADFNLPEDRTALLARFAPGGDLAGKYTGVFFYDAALGIFHEYAPLSFELFYDYPKMDENPRFLLVPIREAETVLRVTDPEHPNCVGRYNSGALDPSFGCVDPRDSAHPAWVGVLNTNPGEGDTGRRGYSLITELEQVYMRFLGQTLCVASPGLDESINGGWATQTDKLCRHSAQWDPAAPNDSGLPMGDWCAATNGPATATCHDAFRTTVYEAYQAFKLQRGDCPAL